MTYSSIVHIPAMKFPKRRITLVYREEAIELKQARLKDRCVLVPAIDLKAYRCQAVLDWVKIELQFKRATHISHIRRELSAATGRSVWVKAMDDKAGGAGTRFRLTLQEPHLRDVVQDLAILELVYGFVAPPIVASLELSIDFYPSLPSDDMRGRLVGILSRHLAAKRDMLSFRNDNPRFAWGEGRSRSNRAWKAPKSASTGDFILDLANDRCLPYDATFYVGAKHASTAWRVMDKVKDRQNKKTGKTLLLSDDQKRARVEVTLSQAELGRRGIFTATDLLHHDWVTMQGDYFGFFLPTFLKEERLGIGDRYWELQRLQRFLNVGLIGLDAMDKQRAADKKKTRSALIRYHRRPGSPIPTAPRVGLGDASTFIAYGELNKRIRTALQTMQDHERRLLRVAERS